MSERFTWQTLHKDESELVRRARVPGGWLVSHLVRTDPPVGPALTFVPDDGHRWLPAAEEASDGEASPSLQEAAQKVVATSAQGIVTTQAELDCFEVVRAILREHDPDAQVGFLDTPTYFGIHLGGPSRWVCRICVTPRASWIALNLQDDDVSPGIKLEQLDGNWAASVRFALKRPEEIRELAPLLIKAAERLG